MSDKRKSGQGQGQGQGFDKGMEKGADTFDNKGFDKGAGNKDMGGKDLGKKDLEGEGSYSGSKQYDDEAEKFRKSGKVDDAAKKAESSFDSSEGSELRNAEREGKSRAKEEDPLLRNNREPPETKR